MGQPTAIEEAIARIEDTIIVNKEHTQALSIFEFKRRFFLRGSYVTLILIREMLLQLREQYDNTTGRLN